MPKLKITRWKCTLYKKTRKILRLITRDVFFKVTTFLWRILILSPGYTSLLFEIATIKFGEPSGREPIWVDKNKYHGSTKTNAHFCSFIQWIVISIKIYLQDKVLHCVKSVQIWNFSSPYFAVFGLNTEISK